MGIDAKLLVNQKWTAQHIKTLLVQGLGREIRSEQCKLDHAFLHVVKPDGDSAMLYIAHTNEYAGLDGTLLSMRASEHNIELLKSISKVLGGFLCESDCSNDWTSHDDGHNGNSRFVVDHVILTNAETNDSALCDKISNAIGYK